PADLRVVDQENIAAMDVIEPVDLHAVLYRHAEIGEKDRQSALILRHRPALVFYDADAVILHLVDHHVIGGPFEHNRHLVGGCFQSAANDFYGNRIDSQKNLLPKTTAHLTVLGRVFTYIRLPVGLQSLAAQLVEKLDDALVAHELRLFVVIVMNDLVQRAAHAFGRLPGGGTHGADGLTHHVG